MPERVELSATDVARIRVGPTLGPFAETVLAYGVVASGTVPADLRGWAQTVRPRLGPADRDLSSFLWLSPSVAFDLFTVVGPRTTMSDSRDALLDGDGSAFAMEADFWARQRRRARQLGLLRDRGPARVPQGLRDGGVQHRGWLFDRVAAFHGLAVADRWPAIQAHLGSARAQLAHRLASDGIEVAVRSLGDRVRWTGSALELPYAGVTARCSSTVRLGGRGLVLTPSFFALEPALYLPTDPTAPAVLITPSRPVQATTGRSPRLQGELLGTTRTAVLSAIAQRSRTTTELSRDLGIAIGGASAHAGVLRRAGLITSTRDGGRVVHELTALGDELLRHLDG